MSDLRFETLISAKPEDVFACWTVNALLMTWLCDGASVQAQAGGAFTLMWYKGSWAAGSFSAVEQHKRLAFSWHEGDAPAATQVELTLAAEGSSTRLTLIQSGFGDGEAWDAYRAGLETAWSERLENLRVTAEIGADARFLKRPLTGVSLYPISAEHAASHGLPFSQAMQLTVIFDDMPGQKAGLYPGDYMVELDGVTQGEFGDYMKVLGSHKAGDTVSVGYYRAGQMHTTDLTLGQRKPEVFPETRDALYDKVKARVTKIEADLEALIAGAPEEALAAKASPTDWSALETLAHLVWAERWYQQVLWLLMTTGEPIPWGENNDFQLGGLLATHTTGAELMAELRRSLREQVEMIRYIPDETLAVRPLYLQLAGVLSYTGEHCRRHYTQITAAIAHAHTAQPV